MNAQELCAGIYYKLLAAPDKRHARLLRETPEDLKSGAATSRDIVYFHGPARLTVSRPDPYLLEFARWRC